MGKRAWFRFSLLTLICILKRVKFIQLPEEQISKHGDLWLLGDHRVLCGDPLCAEDVERLLAGNSVLSVVTNPQVFDISDLQTICALISTNLQPGRAFYLWDQGVNCARYPAILKANDLYFSQAIIWAHDKPIETSLDFHNGHRFCFYGWKQGAGHYFTPEIKNATDVWNLHPKESPVERRSDIQPIEAIIRALTYSTHSSLSLTMDTYAKANSDRMRDIVEKLGDTLGQSKSRKSAENEKGEYLSQSNKKEYMVEMKGVEPSTFALRTRRSTN